MNCFRYFLMLDSFGVGINFYLKGYRDYRSHLGGFITISIYVVTIICGIIFSKELLHKFNPTVSTSSTNNPHPEKINYPENTFFMIGIAEDQIPFIDEKIYRPIAYIDQKINGSEDHIKQNISMELCNKVYNKDYKYYDVIKNVNLSRFYCISLNESKNKVNNNELYVNEFWGNEGFRMLQIKIYNCTSIAKNKSECSSDDIIKKKLTSPIITYYTLKNYIDTNNYKNPFVHALQEYFYYVSYKKYISATQYLKHIQIHSDKGLFFSQEEIIEDHTIDSMIEYSEADPEDGKLFMISIQLTNKIDIYTRSYLKLQDLGAEIVAVYGVLNMVFSFIFNLYNNSKLFISIINNFFIIQEDFKPLTREKRAFINLKRKFYKDLNLIISVDRNKKSFITGHNTHNDFFSPKKNLNLSSISDLHNNNKEFLKTTESLKHSFNKERKENNNVLKNVLTEKKKEEKNNIKINFTYVDRFLCLYLINLCRNKVNRYSYYNLFYKGKDYIIKALDITNYLKYNTFVRMIFLINSKETRDLYEYVTTPILASKYVGPRFKVEEE